MKWMVLVSGVALLACGKKSDGVDKQIVALGDAQGADDAAAPPDLPDAREASKHGYCQVTFTGAAEAEMWTPLIDQSAGSDYWLAEEESAAGKARVKAAEKREAIDLGDYEYPLEFKCADERTWIYIRQALETKRKHVTFGPGDYPFGDGKKAGTMAASFGVPGTGALRDEFTGTLRITRFEPGELEATFEVEGTELTSGKALKATGKIVYHCADYARCGRGGR